MKKVEVRLPGNETYNCAGCFNPLVTYNCITHYSKQSIEKSDTSYLIAQQSEDLKNRVAINEQTVFMNKGLFNGLSLKFIRCKKCDEPIGCYFETVTSQNQDLLQKFIFNVKNLQMNQFGKNAIEMMSAAYQETAEELEKQENERRQKRKAEMKELRDQILSINPEIKIIPNKKINLNQITKWKKPHGFKRSTLRSNSKMFRKQNAITRKAFIVIRIKKRKQCRIKINVNANGNGHRKSILKNKQSTPAPSLQEQQQDQRIKRLFQHKKPIKLKLIKVDAMSKVFKLKRKLREMKIDPRNEAHLSVFKHFHSHAQHINNIFKRFWLEQNKRKKIFQDALSKVTINGDQKLTTGINDLTL